ncbi:MAG TPA: HEAT repeat domain-containing protein, partial [Methanothrix soehngenii]|nr:HEAT repeat domain-containing protein [Methanothrix soehngenii]
MLLQRSNEIDIVKTDQEGAPLRRSTMECPDRERQDLVRPALKRLVPKRPVLEGFILERSALERMALDRSLDHRIRYRAVRALGQLKDPLSEEVLIKALDDDYPIVRHMAVSALVGMRTDRAAYELGRLLSSNSNYVKSMASRALIKIAGVPDS